MSYHDQLDAIAKKFTEAHPQKKLNELDVDATGRITAKGARDLHEALCRFHGCTAEQIVDDWNSRSPQDPW